MGLKGKLANLILGIVVCALSLIVVTSYGGVGKAAAAGTIAITGTVTKSQDGSAVQNVSVYATNPGGSTVEFGPVTTSPDGSYVLYVTAGVYDFHYDTSVGSQLTSQVVGNVSVFSNQTVNVQLLPASHTLSGVLTDLQGNALAGINIRLLGQNGRTYSTATQSDGSFSLTVVIGMYALKIDGDMYEGGSVHNDFSFSLTQAADSPTINLLNGDVRQDLQLGLVQANLNVYDDQGYSRSTSAVYAISDTGSVSLYPGDPGESIQVNNTISGVGGASVGSTDIPVKSIVGVVYGMSMGNGICAFLGAATECNDTAISISGNTTVNVPHAPAPRHTFSGILSDAQGHVLNNATVSLVDQHHNLVTTTTVSDGSYSLSVEPGMYALSISGSDPYTHVANFGMTQSTANPSINMSNGDLVQNLQLETATLNTTIYNDQGYLNNPTEIEAFGAGGTTYLYPGDPGESISLIQAYVGRGVDNISATNELVGTLIGSVYGTATGNGICALVSNNSSWICNKNPITVIGDASLDIPYAPAPRHTFSGVFTDQATHVLSGVLVTLRDQYGNSVSGTTDSTGSYSLSVEPGMYALSAVDSYDQYSKGSFNLSQSKSSPTINIENGDVTQDLQVKTATLSVDLYDAQGKPQTSTSSIGAIAAGGGTAYLYPGDPGESVTAQSSVYGYYPSYILSATNNLLGTVIGATYGTIRSNGICAGANSNNVTVYYCNANNITVTGDMNIILQQSFSTDQSLALSALTPTPQPHLTWTAITGAVIYDIYRDGTLIDTSTSTSYTDTNVSEGAHSYYIAAFNLGGDVSSPSNTIQVTVDQTPPELGSPYWTANPIIVGQSTTVKVPTTDNLSGVKTGEYYIGSTDPGEGNGTAMTLSGGAVTADISGLGAGKYSFNIRAEDRAGLWSAPASTTLEVSTPAPTNLAASTPTQYPALTWDIVTDADHYNIYRNKAYISQSNRPSYTDSTAPEGTDEYLVKAVTSDGVESPASNSVEVLVNRTPPIITYSKDPKTTSAGWNNGPVTVSFSCNTTVQDITIATCSAPVTVSSVGANQTVTGIAVDSSGNMTTVSVPVNIDEGAPTVNAPSWSSNPITVGDTTTLTVPAYNSISGIAGGEYFIGSSDPGTGNGTPMTISAGKLSYTFKSLPVGAYKVNVRAQNEAGNWGPTITTILNVLPPIPAAPTNLGVISPVQNPKLTWTASDGATSYNIYRNGNRIGGSNATYFTDYTAPEGTDSYYVAALNSGGESDPSNTVSVLVDRTAPSISVSQTPAANSNGWNNSDVTVTFQCSDALSGIKSCSDPVTVSTEGADQTVTGSAEDYADNTSSVTVSNLNIDKTAPTASPATITNPDVVYGSQLSTTFAATATDTLSGVTVGEYYVDTDPGEGNGSTMTFANNQLTGTANFSGLAVGAHKLYVRSQDAAGNWSAPASTEFTVRYPVPLAPTNLTAVTPTNQKLALSWTDTPSTPPAVSYNIYRNGSLIGSSTTTDFTDTSLSSDGTYSYYVTAVNQYAVESSHSNLLVAIYDTTKPTVIYALSPAANSNGWNNSNVTVTYSCSDSLSGMQSCPGTYTFSNEGANQSTTATATDNAGNVTNITISGINIDETAPTVSSLKLNGLLNSTLVTSLVPVTISANTADNLSGVVAGEYYVDTDPGVGKGTPLNYSNGQLSTSATLRGLSLGSHTLYVRAEDAAGNWSVVASVQFTFVI